MFYTLCLYVNVPFFQWVSYLFQIIFPLCFVTLLSGLVDWWSSSRKTKTVPQEVKVQGTDIYQNPEHEVYLGGKVRLTVVQRISYSNSFYLHTSPSSPFRALGGAVSVWPPSPRLQTPVHSSWWWWWWWWCGGWRCGWTLPLGDAWRSEAPRRMELSRTPQRTLYRTWRGTFGEPWSCERGEGRLGLGVDGGMVLVELVSVLSFILVPVSLSTLCKGERKERWGEIIMMIKYQHVAWICF